MARGRRTNYDDNMSENVKKDFKEKALAEVRALVPETNNRIITKLVNLRREPNFDSDVVDILRKGARVKILEKTKDFYKIKFAGDRTAYVFSDFIKEE